MNAIEQKLLNEYQEFVDKNGTELPIAVNVLVRDTLGSIFEDCIYITKDGKPSVYGTHAVANINEVINLLSNIDFLPDEFESRAEYASEVKKYTETEEDEDYYFRQNRFGFNVLDIIGFVKLPPIEEDEIIGTKEVVNGGICYTPAATDNGYVFKDFNAIKIREGICYIAECGFEDNDGTLILTPDNTWKYIYEGAVVTYDSAEKQVTDLVRSQFPQFAAIANFDLWHKFVEKITNYILQEVDWCCFSTWLNDMDLEEELQYFLESEFTEFAKNRLAKDGDCTEFADNDELWNKLSSYFGQTCYCHDDYSLTDWTSLIDRWESEPNY